MEIIICKTKEEASRKAAALVAALVKKNPKAVLGLATGSTPEELCGAILRFKADRAEDGSVTLKNVILTPTLTHFGVNKDGYQIFPLSGYGDELAGEHAVSGVTTGGLKSFVRSIVPAEFLPYDYRG